MHNSPKVVLENLLSVWLFGAHKLVHSEPFGLPIRSWTLIAVIAIYPNPKPLTLTPALTLTETLQWSLIRKLSLFRSAPADRPRSAFCRVPMNNSADSNSLQWTKISSIRSQQLAFPHSNRHKQITVFDEDTIFCKNCNLRFLISSPTVCKLK